jgi:acyl-coenzyme A synthetase/AMP-(fatty) acid ligase
MLTAFFCAGAAISEKNYQEGIAYFRAHNCQAEIRNNYGVSEGLCIGTTSDHIPHVPGTVGKFYIGPEWLIVDEDGKEVKYGEIGEAIVSSASLCQGYFNDPQATEKAFIKRDGKIFFKTGDYLSLREDGYVTFVGRKLRFFLADGIFDKVNCETIEEAIDSLRYVKQCAVIVTPDGTGAKAFVTLDDGYLPIKETKKYVLSDLERSLKSYQMPREIVFIDKIPLMESGKVNYKLLEKM